MFGPRRIIVAAGAWRAYKMQTRTGGERKTYLAREIGKRHPSSDIVKHQTAS